MNKLISNTIWNNKYLFLFIIFIIFINSSLQLKDLRVFSGPERILKFAEEKVIHSKNYDENTFLLGLKYNKSIQYSEIILIDSLTNVLESDSNIKIIYSLTNDFRINNSLVPIKNNILDITSEERFIQSINTDSSDYISSDFKKTMMIIEIKDSIPNGPEKYFYKIKDVFSHLNTEDLYISALVASRLYFQGKVIENLLFILIFCSLLCCIILYYFSKNLLFILINIISILIAIVFCFSISNILFGGIELLMLIVPAIIFIICISDFMHLTNFNNKPKLFGKELFIFQLKEMGLPITITSLTTAIGFLSFISSDLVALSRLGIISSIGILISLLITIVFFAISLDLKMKLGGKANDFVNWVENIVPTIHNKLNPKLRIILLLISSTLIFSALFNSRIDSFITDEVNEKSKIYNDVKFFEENFGGMKYMSFFVDLDDNFDVKKLILFEDYLHAKGYTPFFQISKYLNNYKLLNNNIFKKFSSNPYQIKTRSNDIGSMASHKKIKEIKDKAKKLKISLNVGGAGFLWDKVSSKLTVEVLYSLLIAICIISLLFVIINNFNLRFFLIAFVPNIVPILLCIGILNFFNFYLSLSSVFVFAIVFGLIVDDSIHILSSYNFYRKKEQNNHEAIKNAIKTTSVPIIKTTIVLVLSMTPLLFSEFRSLNYLALISIITSIIALFFDLFILPIMIKKIL